MAHFRLVVPLLLLVTLSCASSKPVSNNNRNGLTLESAIIVDSVEAERRWLQEHYPNYRILVQEVVQQSGKSYDVITIRTEEEDRKTFYFDITGISKK